MSITLSLTQATLERLVDLVDSDIYTDAPECRERVQEVQSLARELASALKPPSGDIRAELVFMLTGQHPPAPIEGAFEGGGTAHRNPDEVRPVPPGAILTPVSTTYEPSPADERNDVLWVYGREGRFAAARVLYADDGERGYISAVTGPYTANEAGDFIEAELERDRRRVMDVLAENDRAAGALRLQLAAGAGHASATNGVVMSPCPASPHDDCDECGAEIPSLPGGSIANRHHLQFCSLFEQDAA